MAAGLLPHNLTKWWSRTAFPEWPPRHAVANHLGYHTVNSPVSSSSFSRQIKLHVIGSMGGLTKVASCSDSMAPLRLHQKHTSVNRLEDSFRACSYLEVACLLQTVGQIVGQVPAILHHCRVPSLPHPQELQQSHNTNCHNMGMTSTSCRSRYS